MCGNGVRYLVAVDSGFTLGKVFKSMSHKEGCRSHLLALTI